MIKDLNLNSYQIKREELGNVLSVKLIEQVIEESRNIQD